MSDEALVHVGLRALEDERPRHRVELLDILTIVEGVRAALASSTVAAVEVPEWVGDILNEREAQNQKWGVQRHSWPEWLSILTEEVGEAARDANKTYWADNLDTRTNHILLLRGELIQTAAVAVQIIEHIDELVAAIASASASGEESP